MGKGKKKKKSSKKREPRYTGTGVEPGFLESLRRMFHKQQKYTTVRR